MVTKTVGRITFWIDLVLCLDLEAMKVRYSASHKQKTTTIIIIPFIASELTKNTSFFVVPGSTVHSTVHYKHKKQTLKCLVYRSNVNGKPDKDNINILCKCLPFNNVISYLVLQINKHVQWVGTHIPEITQVNRAQFL